MSLVTALHFISGLKVKAASTSDNFTPEWNFSSVNRFHSFELPLLLTNLALLTLLWARQACHIETGSTTKWLPCFQSKYTAPATHEFSPNHSSGQTDGSKNRLMTLFATSNLAMSSLLAYWHTSSFSPVYFLGTFQIILIMSYLFSPAVFFKQFKIAFILFVQK